MHDADRYQREVAAGPVTEAVREALEAVQAAIAVVSSSAAGPDLDAAVVLSGELQTCSDALDAKVVGEWDSQVRWAGHGAKSAESALAHGRRAPIETCRAPRLARKLRELPAVALAWEAGRIHTAHVQRIVRADNPRVHDELVADQVEITRWAMADHWRPFCRKLAAWLDEHDLDGAEPDGRATRRFHCSKTLQDRYAVDGLLDTIGGSIFAAELERLEGKLYEEDLAEARDRLGIAEPLPFQLRRTPEQRRADALVLMAERSATGPEDGRRGRILLTVLAGHDSLARILEATNGIALRAGQLVPWIDALAIEQVLFDGPSTVVKVSHQRNFTGTIRKAVEVRDRGCQHPLCDEPIDRCQVDHIVPASAGGPTSQENGRLLCGHHNRLRHRRPPPRRIERSTPDDDPDH